MITGVLPPRGTKQACLIDFSADLVTFMSDLNTSYFNKCFEGKRGYKYCSCSWLLIYDRAQLPLPELFDVS